MNATLNINLEMLNKSPQILISIHKQACTSQAHRGCIVGFQHLAQHLLHGRGVHGKEKTKVAEGKQGWRAGGYGWVAMSSAMVHGAVWGVP